MEVGVYVLFVFGVKIRNSQSKPTLALLPVFYSLILKKMVFPNPDQKDPGDAVKLYINI